MAGLFALMRSKLSDAGYREKSIYTVCLFFCFSAVGMNVSQTGPALLDLQLITHTNTQQASIFLTAGSMGSMGGSLIMGCIYGRWNKFFIMSFSLLGTAVTTTVLPWCSDYVLMIVLQVLVAIFRGAFTTAAIVEVIRTWAPESRVPTQILNTCLSVGGSLGPLILQPFLAPKTNSSSTVENASSVYAPPLTNVNISRLSEANENSSISNNTPAETHIQFAYLIVGLWFLVGSLVFLIQYFCSGEEVTPVSTSGGYESLDKPLPRPMFIVTLSSLFLLIYFTISIQSSMASFLLTFAVTHLNWTKPEGATLTTLYWLCLAFGRFIYIFFTKFVSPIKFLLVSVFIVLIAIVGNVMFSVYRYDIGIWICTGLTGLCISSQMPSIMMWTEESIMRLTPRIVSVFNFSITFPGMVVPLILGYLMQVVTPVWLFYLNVIHCGIQLFILIFLSIWIRLIVQPTHKRLNRADAWNEDLTDSDYTDT